MPGPWFTIIDEGHPVEVRANVDGDTVYLSPKAIQTALGWELKPEGLCRQANCIPVPEGSLRVTPFGIDLAGVVAILGRLIVIDPEERAAYLGTSARDRGEALSSLQAPDFTLPDLDGRLHSLSDHRGKKVLLVAYASW